MGQSILDKHRDLLALLFKKFLFISIQYSCLGNPMDRGALMGCSPQGRTESDTTEPVQHAQRNDTPVGPLAPWTWFVHGGNMTWHHGFLFWPRLFMVVWGCTERCRRVSSILRLYPRDPSNINLTFMTQPNSPPQAYDAISIIIILKRKTLTL